MFLQFSPPMRKPEKKSINTVKEAEQLSCLSLAPFTPIPKIVFDNVTVGERSVHILIIKNPLNHSIHLQTQLDCPDEITLELSWLQCILEKNSEVALELAWTPRTEGAWRHVFHLSDGSRIQRDIPIVFKSVVSKKAKVGGAKVKAKGLPTFASKKIKSPLHKVMRRKSPTKRAILPNITNIPNIVTTHCNDNALSSGVGKENFAPQLTCVRLAKDRRETYIVSHQLNSPDPYFSDSLETNSPVKSPMMCKFTPFDKRLQSTTFMFSPMATPKSNLADFNPEHCSTDEKSINNTTTHGKQLRLFSDKNSTFEIQGEDNISATTYVKENISTETYIKGDLSGETYVKDISVGDVRALPLSPINHQLDSSPGNLIENTIETNAWNSYKVHRPLLCITEESYINDSVSTSTLKRKGDRGFNMTPHKRANLSLGGLADWSIQAGQAFRIARKSTGLNISNKEVTKRDTSTVIIQNPFLLAAVDKLDPFMTSSIYLDEEWMETQEKNFKKWLNALLTPPIELHTDAEGHPIDVAKLWRDCKNKEVAAAPTKEKVCIQYHTSSRLNGLRKSASNLFKSKEINGVLIKVMAAVESNRLCIREDRNVHLDLALQSDIMSIILSYNPLWLRIGLETIYNVLIPMNSNSDLMALTSFLFERFFKDPHLLKKYKTIHCAKYNAAIKKFILKQFFILVYFLDRAKNKKLIRHDPCLFCKNAPIKESREALLKFARECLSAVGDITRYLKYFDYIVYHKQTYINEFDYAVNCLGVDLRDGVRLTRVMEIILLKDGLSKELRVPAISKLQKIHNMKIVFDSLEKAGFEILYDICPKDVVNGHKEKTLSFLWQIIYKFQAPLIVKSVSTVQKWWRSDRIIAKRKQLLAIHSKKCAAAEKIQKWYRNRKFALKIELFSQFVELYIQHLRQDSAATKIQNYVRMYLTRKKFIAIRKSVIWIQLHARRWLVNNQRKRTSAAVVIQSFVRMFIMKRKFQILKYCALFVEQRYVAKKMMRIERERFENFKYSALRMKQVFRAKKLGKQVRNEYAILKSATLLIQRRFRANRLRNIELNRYQTLKQSAVIIQSWYRSSVQRNKFNELKAATIVIQRWYKSKVITRFGMYEFQVLRETVIKIQRYYRANILANIQKKQYDKLREITVVMQRRYRAKLAMRKEVKHYRILRNATILLQRSYRAKVAMQLEVQRFKTLKDATVAIQKYYRAYIVAKLQKKGFDRLRQNVIIIQRRYRAKLLTREHVRDFLTTKTAVIFVQRRYRAKMAMQLEVQKFTALRQAVLTVQIYYRSNVLARMQKSEYNKLKQAVVMMQKRFRAKLLMRDEMKKYHALKNATVVVQKHYRARLAMKLHVQRFRTLRNATISIQRRYRANAIAKIDKSNFYRLKQSAVVIQRRYRATLRIRVEMKKFKLSKDAAIVLQRRYRARAAMKLEIQRFSTLRRATITVQRFYRANVMTKSQRNKFCQLKEAVILIQTRYRGKLRMVEERRTFQNLKQIVIMLQRRYRAKLAMKLEMQRFETLRRVTVAVQRRYRATIIAKLHKNNFSRLKQSVILTQTRYRSKLLMREEMRKFQGLRKAAITLQRLYRGRLIMKLERENFERMRTATVVIQRRVRAKLLMRKDYETFANLKKTAVTLQRRYRAKVAMEIERQKFQVLKTATLTIQRRYRSKVISHCQRTNYQRLRQAVVIIQQRYRAHLHMRIEMQKFKSLRDAVVTLQRRYKARLSMKLELQLFTKLKEATIILQIRHRARFHMKQEMLRFQKMKSAAILIQRRYRAIILMRYAMRIFETKKNAAVVIQRCFKKYLSNKIEKTNKCRVNAIVMIQRFVRGFLVRKQYAHQLTPGAIAERKIMRQQNSAAVRIQSAWRGHKSRSLEKPELEKIRSRSKKANANAVPQKTLASRCQNAVILLSSESLLEIISALQDLDFITRRCKDTCTKLSSVLPKHLYSTITSTNRSPAEMKACTAATHILINFYKYEPTRSNSWIPECMDSLITALLHCCDKEDALFPTLCTLVWLFCHTKEYKKAIRETPNFIPKMDKIEALCLRKEKMVNKVKVNYESFFVTPPKLYLPTINPDWGLEYPSQPKIFCNSVQAFKCLKSIMKC